MVSYNVLVVQVFEDVAIRGSGNDQISIRLGSKILTQHRRMNTTHTSATICFLSLSLIRSKLSSFRANIWSPSQNKLHDSTQKKERTRPSAFRLTFLITPNEPFPMTSSGSYRCKKEDIKSSLSADHRGHGRVVEDRIQKPTWRDFFIT